MLTDSDSPAARLRLALDLFGAGVDLMRQNLKRLDPEAPPAEIEQRLVRWLSSRPGAEHGDSAGRSVPWPTPRG
jgi:Rv0078B-related antitoxin